MKRARVRYEKREDGSEWYNIELWDKKYQDWGLDKAFPFVEGEYLHYKCVLELIELSKLGYVFV